MLISGLWSNGTMGSSYPSQCSDPCRSLVSVSIREEGYIISSNHRREVVQSEMLRVLVVLVVLAVATAFSPAGRVSKSR